MRFRLFLQNPFLRRWGGAEGYEGVGARYFFTRSTNKIWLAGISKYRDSNYWVRLTNLWLKDYVMTNVIHCSLWTVYKYRTTDYWETRNGCSCFINRKNAHLNNCHNHTWLWNVTQVPDLRDVITALYNYNYRRKIFSWKLAGCSGFQNRAINVKKLYRKFITL